MGPYIEAVKAGSVHSAGLSETWSDRCCTPDKASISSRDWLLRCRPELARSLAQSWSSLWLTSAIDRHSQLRHLHRCDLVRYDVGRFGHGRVRTDHRIVSRYTSAVRLTYFNEVEISGLIGLIESLSRVRPKCGLLSARLVLRHRLALARLISESSFQMHGLTPDDKFVSE